MIPQVEFAFKDELDFEIIVKKKTHHFYDSVCSNESCQHKEKIEIPILKKRRSNFNLFANELKVDIIHHPIIYWNDTVIMISKNIAYLGFYGDEKLALYTAYAKKDKAE